MITLIRRQSYAKPGSMKVLDYSLSSHAGNCEKFIEVEGLKTLFAVYMYTAQSRAEKKSEPAVEEHMLSVIVQLFLYVHDVSLMRLLRKFQENDYSKVVRLCELLHKYHGHIARQEQIYQQQREGEEEEDAVSNSY